MNNFIFSNTPELIFGSGCIQSLSQKLKQFGEFGLIVIGKSSFKKSIHFDNLNKLLINNNLYFEIISVETEPDYLFIDTQCSFFRKKAVKWVVSIGGGSVMDAGKAISAMLPMDESIYPFLEGSEGFKKYSGIKIPFIAIPTTAGTGSEATKNAVISGTREKGFKRSLRHDSLVPNIAIIDPKLHVHCPANVTAASGLDALTQLIESYVSTNASPLSDALAFEGIKKAIDALPAVYKDGSNINARAEMAYAAYLSGITLANAGLGTTHGFASTIGGMFDAPHGAICGTLMGAVNKANIELLLKNDLQNIALPKYALIGKLFSNDVSKDETYYISLAKDKIVELVDKLDVPRLSVYGITKDDLAAIAENTGNKNNPVKLSKEELIRALRERL